MERPECAFVLCANSEGPGQPAHDLVYKYFLKQPIIPIVGNECSDQPALMNKLIRTFVSCTWQKVYFHALYIISFYLRPSLSKDQDTKLDLMYLVPICVTSNRKFKPEVTSHRTLL